MTDQPLHGVRVVSVAGNLPGPATVARLVQQGVSATTVLPPSGDPLEQHAKAYFDALHAGQEIERLDLKVPSGQERLHTLLAEADVLITSSRPSALQRLGLDHSTLQSRHPQLCQIDIVGHFGDEAERPSHDLTHQATAGLLRDGQLPTSTVVDLTAAERAAGEAVAALLQRSRTGRGHRRAVALAEVATALAAPRRHRLTTPDGPLGGALAVYAIHPTAQGQVALAALEAHFVERLRTALGLSPAELTHDRLAEVFAQRTAREWAAWAIRHDLPLVAVTSDE